MTLAVKSVFLLCFAMGISHAAEPAHAYPLWDNHESVESYAKKVNLPATKTLDLGGGVKLELVLIPAGTYLMGTPEPVKPTITVLSGQVLIGIGAVLTLALLVFLLKRRRFSFSLRWLLALSLACSFMVWGGTRWYLAVVQNKEYAEAARNYQFFVEYDEKPAHQVLLSSPFYMGKFDMTQEQYMAVTGKNPSVVKAPNNPVESVSWYDAVAFCKILNDRMPLENFQLPTEAQWEFACRAGTSSRFYSGDAESDLDSVAWYDGNSGGKPHPVGLKKPNAFGLFDMHGNVWQWCQDSYKPYDAVPALDPSPSGEKTHRNLRGESYFCGLGTGGWSSKRRGYRPEAVSPDFGFRVIVSDKSR